MLARRQLNLFASASVMGLALSIASPVTAQETSTTNEGEGAIREIVVTAQKRAESVQAVPIAVTVLDAKALDSDTISDIRDIAGRVPSLVVDSVGAGPSAAAISIRGISFEDIEKSFDPAVGVVVDGVFIGTNTGQLLDSFDLERLEVLRGPQGTLFGRNTIGGVLNVTRTRPTQAAGAKGQFAYSSFNTKRGRLVVNSGRIGDFISLKGFGFYDKTDGYYFNVTKNRKEGRYETLSGGVTALIEPTPGVTAQITYEHSRERGETIVAPLSETGKDVFCIAPGAPNFSPAEQCNRFSLPEHGLYTTFSQLDTPVRNDTDAVTGNLDIKLGDRFTLTSVTGYRKNRESVRQDFDATSTNFFDTLRVQDYKQFSQELRLVGDITDNVNLLIGGYYFNSSYTLDQTTNLGALATGGPPLALRQFVNHNAKSYAGFADVRFHLSPSLTVAVGGRYTHDEKKIFNNYGRIGAIVRISQPTFDGTSCVAVTGTLTLAPGVVVPTYSPASNCNGAASFNKFTWRANADYEIDPVKHVYASFNRGFRSGGFNGRGGSPSSLGPYQPETVDAFEVGLKADWLDRTLRTNLAMYYTKYKNKQEEIVQATPPGSPSPQETVVKNASSASIKGFEAEVIVQMARNFSANFSFTYTDAKFDSFFNDVVGLTVGSPPDGIPDDVSTLSLRRAPKYQWSAGLNYTHELGNGHFDASALLRFQSKYATCIAPARPRIPGAIVTDERCITEDRENLSAQLGYTFNVGTGEFNISVFGRNLTNHRGLAATLPVAGLFTFGTAIAPRSYGIEAGFKF